jgi:asparagine synthetase B (glutamine-hydrolysing)
MCGIAGFIGESKKPILTFQLISKLFEKSEIRGVDAAGYWGVEAGDNGKVLYHKEPGKSSQFVKKDAWKKISKYNPNLFLVHARGASKGVGEPHCNVNNHPFANSEKSLALVHNGRIEDHEYQPLLQKYEVKSNCDSEILLRIIEGANHYSANDLKEFAVEHPHRMAGIRDVFSLINDGHMAVALGDRGDGGERRLWLFRNRHRPIWIVDMRETLGQVFFVSEPKIWEDAVRECATVARIVHTQKLIELPVEEIWYFKINKDIASPQGVQRFEVVRENGLTPWTYDGKRVEISKRVPPCEVVTALNEWDELDVPNQQRMVKKEPDLDTSELERKCRDIQDLVDNILTATSNLVQEQSIIPEDLQEIVSSLDNVHRDLEGTFSIIEK